MRMDKEALFREAFESGKDAIYRICCCYVRNPEDRNDAFQEVLLRLYRHIGSFQGKASLKTWIYRITVNTCLDFLRAQSRRERILDRKYEEDLTNVSDPGKYGPQVDGELDVARMYACIQRLPVLDRTLLSLYLEEASTKEMAEVMGISESNVRVKLSRIKDVLRKMLEGKKNGSR
jgi:RNA polymerase sigma-70 factor (ECF subfamily)